MKILRLDLRAFGPFSDMVLDLSGGQEGLHLILGSNEAGKSSALRALRQMLFGIDPRTNDNFRHEYAQLRVGGTLRNGHGEELAFLRLKRQRNTLKTPDEAADIDDAEVAKLLGGLTPERYGSLFSLDHDTLVSGGREITAGKGSVAELIFGAGSDLRRLRELQKKLDEAHSSLFKARGSVPPLNKSFQELNDAREAIEKASLKSDEWVAENDRLTESARRKADLDARLQDLQREANRLHRIRLALPDLSDRRERLAALERLADAPRLREDFAASHLSAKADLQQARISLEFSENEVARLSEEIEALGPLSPLLPHRDRVVDFSQRLASLRSRASEVQRIEPETKLLEARVLKALRDLDRPMSLEHAEGLRLPAAQRERIRALENSGRDILMDCNNNHRSIDSAQARLTELRENLDDLPAPVDVSAIRAALKRALQAGDLEDRLRTGRREVARQETRTASALEKLELSVSSLDEIGRLAVPSEATIETHRETLEAAEQNVTRTREALVEIQEQHAQTCADLTALQKNRAVPTLEDLKGVRSKRDALWSRIEPHLNGSAESPDPRLGEEFRQALEEADQISDLRFSEVDRLAQFDRLEADRLRLEAVMASRQEQHEQATRNQQAALARWNALWTPLGFEPRSPREMLSWHRDFDRLATKLDEQRQEKSRLEDDAARLEALRSDLAASLAAAGFSRSASELTLADLADRAESFVEAEKQRDADRKRLMRDLEKENQNLKALRDEEKDQLRRLQDWKAAWSKALEPLGLAPETSGTGSTQDSRPDPIGTGRIRAPGPASPADRHARPGIAPSRNRGSRVRRLARARPQGRVPRPPHRRAGPAASGGDQRQVPPRKPGLEPRHPAR